jgi:hypothetical protein
MAMLEGRVAGNCARAAGLARRLETGAPIGHRRHAVASGALAPHRSTTIDPGRSPGGVATT